MKHAEMPAISAFVVQLDGIRLVPVLEDFGVVFQFINRSQFDSMAFELDGHAHFSAGIPATNI